MACPPCNPSLVFKDMSGGQAEASYRRSLRASLHIRIPTGLAPQHVGGVEAGRLGASAGCVQLGLPPVLRCTGVPAQRRCTPLGSRQRSRRPHACAPPPRPRDALRPPRSHPLRRAPHRCAFASRTAPPRSHPFDAASRTAPLRSPPSHRAPLHRRVSHPAPRPLRAAASVASGTVPPRLPLVRHRVAHPAPRLVRRCGRRVAHRSVAPRIRRDHIRCAPTPPLRPSSRRASSVEQQAISSTRRAPMRGVGSGCLLLMSFV